MAWLRYTLYFALIAVITLMLTQLEVLYPGSLQLLVYTTPADALGTSEYSPVEIIQPLILVLCGLLMVWVAHSASTQRPVAIPLGGLALAFMLREIDFFLDIYLVDNLWQILIGIAGALVIVYSYRQRRRLPIALGRLWPSPALTLLFVGGIVLFVFARLVGREALWQAIMGEHYLPVVTLAVEEFLELLGYLVWLIGAIEYSFQVRTMLAREPQAAAVKRRRAQRKRDPETTTKE